MTNELPWYILIYYVTVEKVWFVSVKRVILYFALTTFILGQTLICIQVSIREHAAIELAPMEFLTQKITTLKLEGMIKNLSLTFNHHNTGTHLKDLAV